MIIPNKHSGYQAGIRRYYMGGGGSLGSTGSIFSSASNADPYTSANRPNFVPYGTNGQFNQPIYQPKYENYNTGNSMNVSQYGQPRNVASQTTQPLPVQPPQQLPQQLPRQLASFMQGQQQPTQEMMRNFQNAPQTSSNQLALQQQSAYDKAVQSMQYGSNMGLGGGGFGGGYGGFMPQQQMYQPQQQMYQPQQQMYQPQQQMQPSFNYQQPSYGRSNFIYDAPLPEGMSGTMGGTGYNPATGRLDLGTAGGSGQFTPQTMQPLPIQPAPTNYGPSQAIVGRSAQMRGTPNVMRRAEGGIASLTSNIE